VRTVAKRVGRAKPQRDGWGGGGWGPTRTGLGVQGRTHGLTTGAKARGPSRKKRGWKSQVKPTLGPKGRGGMILPTGAEGRGEPTDLRCQGRATIAKTNCIANSQLLPNGDVVLPTVLRKAERIHGLTVGPSRATPVAKKRIGIANPTLGLNAMAVLKPSLSECTSEPTTGTGAKAGANQHTTPNGKQIQHRRIRLRTHTNKYCYKHTSDQYVGRATNTDTPTATDTKKQVQHRRIRRRTHLTNTSTNTTNSNKNSDGRPKKPRQTPVANKNKQRVYRDYRVRRPIRPTPQPHQRQQIRRPLHLI